MKKRSLKIMMLFAFLWVIYANAQMLGHAADLVSKTYSDLGVKMEMRKIAMCIRMEYLDTGKVPTDPVAVFRQHLLAADMAAGPDTGKDPWGTFYRLAPAADGFYLGSAGPDRNWTTKQDNVVFHQSLRDVGFRGAEGGGRQQTPRR